MVYKGSEPPPDTFKDDSQALAEGTIGRDGVFHASALQAKCASKYAPAQPRRQPLLNPPRATANPRATAAPAPRPGNSGRCSRDQLISMTAQAPEAATSTLCAHLENVSKLFGSFAALRQVSVDLEPGRCYVLIGENGAGKSTLLRILAGLLRPSGGTIKVFGDHGPARCSRPHRLHEPRPHALRRAHRPGKPALLRRSLPRSRLP